MARLETLEQIAYEMACVILGGEAEDERDDLDMDRDHYEALSLDEE